MFSQGPETGIYRHDYLRVVFEQDSDGKIVRSEEGKRLVAAVERISGGVVIETMPVKPPAQTEENLVEPVVETILLEN